MYSTNTANQQRIQQLRELEQQISRDEEDVQRLENEIRRLELELDNTRHTHQERVVALDGQIALLETLVQKEEQQVVSDSEEEMDREGVKAQRASVLEDSLELEEIAAAAKAALLMAIADSSDDEAAPASPIRSTPRTRSEELKMVEEERRREREARKRAPSSEVSSPDRSPTLRGSDEEERAKREERRRLKEEQWRIAEEERKRKRDEQRQKLMEERKNIMRGSAGSVPLRRSEEVKDSGSNVINIESPTPTRRRVSDMASIYDNRKDHAPAEKPQEIITEPSTPAPEEVADETVASAETAAPSTPAKRFYTYKELVIRPAHLDPLKLESYLSDEEFKKVFGMDKTAFYAMARWRQDKFKKDKKLW